MGGSTSTRGVRAVFSSVSDVVEEPPVGDHAVVHDPLDEVAADVIGRLGADPADVASRAGGAMPAALVAAWALPAHRVVGAGVTAVAEHKTEAVADEERVAGAGDGATDVALKAWRGGGGSGCRQQRGGARERDQDQQLLHPSHGWGLYGVALRSRASGVAASGVRGRRYCRGVPGDIGAVPVRAGSGRDLQIARMNAGLMTTTVMSAVVVFLAGALLVAHSVRPEAALILLSTSALGFIVATLLYANTYAWLLEPPDAARFQSQIHRANVVSECFGVYCLLLAIPVTIVAVTRDDAVRWFVAVVTLLALVGYQMSGASLLSHYLAQHPSRWRRAVISLIGAAFTALLVGLGAWLFVAAVSGSSARLVPAFVIVGFLTLAGAYAIWAEPLQSRASSPETPAPAVVPPAVVPAAVAPPAQPRPF